uniref:Putative nadh dehydrogenase subunit 4l mitochondrion n=1 Tax=Anopheles darlingi TaxID=43151 RepID=A0A2M4D024_ANODA
MFCVVRVLFSVFFVFNCVPFVSVFEFEFLVSMFEPFRSLASFLHLIPLLFIRFRFLVQQSFFQSFSICTPVCYKCY